MRDHRGARWEIDTQLYFGTDRRVAGSRSLDLAVYRESNVQSMPNMTAIVSGHVGSDVEEKNKVMPEQSYTSPHKGRGISTRVGSRGASFKPT